MGITAMNTATIDENARRMARAGDLGITVKLLDIIERLESENRAKDAAIASMSDTIADLASRCDVYESVLIEHYRHLADAKKRVRAIELLQKAAEQCITLLTAEAISRDEVQMPPWYQ
jgi:hypothetical protein